ncbi:hypothetical protein MMC11_000311 [Xylographa trunciseda]|nr:hypothetical protein [Xylographa trunciseda]
MPSVTSSFSTADLNDITSDAFSSRIAALVQALEAHPLMNRSNPKASPNSLFWVWDFVTRTQQMLGELNLSALRSGDMAAREQYQDVIGRCAMSEQMIASDKGGMILQMMCRGEEPVQFTEEVKQKARALSVRGA